MVDCNPISSSTMQLDSLEGNFDTLLEQENHVENVGKILEKLVNEVTNLIYDPTFWDGGKDVDEIFKSIADANNIIAEKGEIKLRIDNIAIKYGLQYTNANVEEEAIIEAREYKERSDVLNAYIPNQRKVYNQLKNLYIDLGGDLSKLETLAEPFHAEEHFDYYTNNELGRSYYEDRSNES